VFTVCALIVIFAELTFYFNPNQNYLADIFENYALNPNAKSYFMANLVCLIPLGYICAAANFGMFNFKLFSLYQLHNHQQTEPSHLLWSALLLTRLSYGVAYNFLELVNIKTCAFFDVMGPISQVDFLGQGFNAWGFTSVLFFMIFITVTDCWSRCLTCIGLP